MLAGTSTPRYGQSDGWLVRVDASGATQWERTLGVGAGSFSAVVRASDGGYVAAGTLDRSDRFSDGWVVKVDAGGNTEWERRFGAECEFARLNAIVQASDGSYAAAGARRVCPSSWDGWVVKFT